MLRFAAERTCGLLGCCFGISGSGWLIIEIDLDERDDSGCRCKDLSMLKRGCGFANSLTSSRCFLRMLDVSVNPVPGF